MTQRVVVLVLDGVGDTAAALTWEVLSLAAEVAEQDGSVSLLVERVGIDSRQPTSDGGAVLQVERALAGLTDPPGAVVIPGLGRRSLDSTWSLQGGVRTMLAWLRHVHARGSIVAAGGGSVLLLAEAGLLRGRRCTTTPALYDRLRRACQSALIDPESRVTRSSGVFCAALELAHVDLALAVVEQLVGEDIAASTSVRYGRRQGPARSPVGKAPLAEATAVARAETWIRENLDRPFTIAELAEGLSLSPRTLARHVRASHGLSPKELVQKIRLASAAHLLATTSFTVHEVARLVGHRDPTQLRRLFNRAVGRSPSAYRRDPRDE